MTLSHLRVVEIGSAPASSYCARLFADFGATVQKIEPPTGDPLRRRGPFTPQGASPFFAFLNFNKSSVVLEAADSAKLAQIVAGCDILIDGRDVDAAGCPALDLDALKQNNPGLIHVETSWFGHAGPYDGFAATDTTVRALVGLVKLIGPAEGPPCAGAPDFQTGIFGGLWGFIAAASSVISRMHDGYGRTSKLSLYEASIAVTEYIMFEAFTRGDIMRRIGVNRFWPTFPVGIYKTKDGWLGVTTVTPAQWRAFCEMLDLIELRDDATLFLGVDRLGRKEEIEHKFVPKLAEKTTAEWFAQGLKRRIPLVPVPSIAELIANEEARSRGAIVPIEIGSERGFTVGSAQRLTGTPPRRGGKVPGLGEMTAHAKVATTAAPPRPTAPRDPKRLPLEGIRVVDFSMGWAGPICTRNLADLGADVIKIEAIQYPDWWRGVDRRPAYVQGREYEKVPRFCIMNRNKRGITLDLTRKEGRELAKRLIAGADLVVDNYSVEVLPKLGLGYDVLHKLNPKLVVMSMSAFGSHSVNRDCRAYGSTLEQGSGLPSVVGRPEWAPTMSHTAFGDAIGGLNGCVAVLVALDSRTSHRRGPVHRPLADRGHDAVRGAVGDQAFDRRQRTDPLRQPPSGFRAARRVPLRGPRRLGRDGVRVGRDVAEAVSAVETRGLGTRCFDGDRCRPPRARGRDRAGDRGVDQHARSRRRDARIAGRWRRRRRGAAAGRTSEGRAAARARLHSGYRPRLHRKAPAAVAAVPRERTAVRDPLRAADARRIQ